MWLCVKHTKRNQHFTIFKHFILYSISVDQSSINQSIDHHFSIIIIRDHHHSWSFRLIIFSQVQFGTVHFSSVLVHFSSVSALFSSVKFNSVSHKSRSKVFWSIILHINHILHKLILITSNTSLVTGITSTSGLSPGCNE